MGGVWSGMLGIVREGEEVVEVVETVSHFERHLGEACSL